MSTGRTRQVLRHSTGWLVCLGMLACPVGSVAMRAPQGSAAAGVNRQQPARAWAEAAAQHQLAILKAGHAVPLRYREQRTDARGTTEREVIETQEGNVARTLMRNGAPLNAEENQAEEARLQGILQDPETYLKRHHRAAEEESSHNYAAELVQQLPAAMLWSYVPGQPTLAGVDRPQVVLDFVPDPQYKPASLLSEGLQGLAGRVWIDAETGCVLRIEGRILKPVEFGWGGMLAKVNQGGTIEMEQRLVGGRRWVYTRLGEDLAIREVMVHTVTEKAQVTVLQAEMLPRPVSLQEGLRELLAMPGR